MNSGSAAHQADDSSWGDRRMCHEKTACNIAAVIQDYNQLQNASGEGTRMPDDKAKTIRSIFAAYLANDRKAVEEAFTDDFRFTSPYDDHIDKPTYFARCWRVADWIERHQLERIVVEGDGAFVIYKCLAKGGKSFRNTEFFTFDRDKIKRIDVYFGATYQDGVFVRQNEN
jgi:ketosteroid isomerase-like protein